MMRQQEKSLVLNKKYFCVSDVHGFYNQMINALNTAGYSKDNENHILIVNGDIFDRGPDSKKIYTFLRSISKSRLILIKGNHEQLVIDVVKKDFPDKADFHNGTVSTILQFADEPESALNDLIYNSFFYSLKQNMKNLESYWKSLTTHSEVKEMIEWLKSKEWIDFYELDNFIFVHSFIPLSSEQTTLSNYLSERFLYDYKPNWRTDSTQNEWFESRWGCPWKQYQAGLFSEEEKKGKTLVCGHWHTNDFHRNLSEDLISTRNDIYFSKGIIALDGGVRKSNDEYIYDCNVLVIENKECYDKLNNKLSID